VVRASVNKVVTADLVAVMDRHPGRMRAAVVIRTAGSTAADTVAVTPSVIMAWATAADTDMATVDTGARLVATGMAGSSATPCAASVIMAVVVDTDAVVDTAQAGAMVAVAVPAAAGVTAVAVVGIRATAIAAMAAGIVALTVHAVVTTVLAAGMTTTVATGATVRDPDAAMTIATVRDAITTTSQSES
jgi:hypothetical protein